MTDARNFEELYSQETQAEIRRFEEANRYLTSMAEKLEIPLFWDKFTDRRLHNAYAKNLVCVYVSKFSQLSRSLLIGVRSADFLIYALCARSLIELTATLHYYITRQYARLFNETSKKGQWTSADMEELIQIDHRHLHGTRFDWDSFLFRNYLKLKEDVVRSLKEKKEKKKNKAKLSHKGFSKIAQAIVSDQVNVLTCIEQWASETPEVLIAYNLFCDLVHPNVGSNYLVTSFTTDKVYFTKDKGSMLGRSIFEQSFPILVSVTKPFGTDLSILMHTFWSEDELDS